jgi:D-alanine-D-alanine ligase
MTQRIRVGVIFGGRSTEHEVSLASARAVLAALDPGRYEVLPVGITPAGKWLTTGDPMALLSSEQPPAANAIESSLTSSASRELVPGATGKTFPKLDVVFPVLHGTFGEDGTIQGLFELANVPYVGCGVLASAVAMDKIVSKDLFKQHGLPVALGQTVKRKGWKTDPSQVLNTVENMLRYPVFVKPANMGSSVGVSKAENRAELADGLTEAARYDRKILVEEAVANAREIECSVLGNDDPIVSVPGEVVPSNEFYDYSAKYIDGCSELLIPAPISAEKVTEIRELAAQAFMAIDGAGLARVDFLLNDDTGELILNEINTMPGFTSISMYAKLWEASGIKYPELIDRLIACALERHSDQLRSETVFGDAMQRQAPETGQDM